MINLKTAKITDIQFFDRTHEIVSEYDRDGEPTGYEFFQEYSANIILNDSLIIQLSGQEDECSPPSIPMHSEINWKDGTEEIQDWACENIDIDDIEKFFDDLGVENNFHWLNENATENY